VTPRQLLGVFGVFCPVKYVRLTWFLIRDQGSLVVLCMQDYKSLCAAVKICPTLVNIHTHRQHFDQLILRAQPAELKTCNVAYFWTLSTIRNSSGDEIPECNIRKYTSFAFNAPEGGVPLGRSWLKYCAEVEKWLRYKMAKKHCQKFQLPEYGAWTLQTYTRQTDSW